jgi:hypothetical protein
LRKHVGLSVYVEINGILHTALQKRGLYDHEDGFKDESWAGGLQPLVHGKMEDFDADPFQALIREGGEEVGKEFMTEVIKYPTRIEDSETAFCMAAKMELESLELIRWHVSSGGLVLLTEEKFNNTLNLKSLDSKKLVTSIALFPDDLKFVMKGFELYRK